MDLREFTSLRKGQEQVLIAKKAFTGPSSIDMPCMDHTSYILLCMNLVLGHHFLLLIGNGALGKDSVLLCTLK